jgi:hypothetical protein
MVFCLGAQGHRCQHSGRLSLADLPDWDWYDISAHLRCTECGAVDWVATPPRLERGDRFQQGHFVKKPLDLPPVVARAFVKDMKAYFAEGDVTKRDAIAVRQLHALKEHQGPREKKLRLSDIKGMFQQMKDRA